jgi:hypothetical protein
MGGESIDDHAMMDGSETREAVHRPLLMEERRPVCLTHCCSGECESVHYPMLMDVRMRNPTHFGCDAPLLMAVREAVHHC